MNGKKAMSEIVSTVLIIMISVVAVGIISAVVIPMVREGLEGGSICLEVPTDISIDGSRSCVTRDLCINKSTSNYYKADGGTCNDGDGSPIANISIAIGKGPSEKVQLAKVIIQAIDPVSGTDPIEMDDLSLKDNEVRIFELTNISNTVDSVSLVPYVKIGKKSKSCDALEPVKLPLCNN